MLGAAGRTAGGLVKQAVKAGNVQQILPTASVSRKYLFPFYWNILLSFSSLSVLLKMKFVTEAAILTADGRHFSMRTVNKFGILKYLF